MLSKNKIQLIKSLRTKKKRKELGLFIVEGRKSVDELLSYFPCSLLFHTIEYVSDVAVAYKQQVSENELKTISLLEQPQQVLAVFAMPENKQWSNTILSEQLILVIDNIQDPGNLGTIIRVADWFGIRHIVCSIGTVDAYNPKTIQATMGSIGRVAVYYTDMEVFFNTLPVGYPVYGTFIEGENMYQSDLQQEALIVMGNEGNGISPLVQKYVTHKITIPNYPVNELAPESLNVAMATAIVCGEFRRRQF
ncbi:MAG: RNA methyltransferase [Paludibacteraceae bacterium]|nr:RNA methyltransferase [Paludibacteraceae bacterium]